PDQVVAELLVVEQLPSQVERHREQHRRHDERDAAEEQCAQAVAGLAPARAVARAPEERLQQEGERRRHSSISWNAPPPVIFRNTDVSCGSSVPASACSSATVPRATMRPPWMMLMRSHISCATSSVCVLIRIATPFRVISRKTSLMSDMPRGSSP